MKKVLYYLTRLFLVSLALILLVTLGFPAPALPAVLLIVAILVLMNAYPSPKIEKIMASVTIVTLCFALISMTLGGWGYKKFKQNFPIMAGTLSRVFLGLDLQSAAKTDPAMVEAKLKLLLLQREKEQELSDLVAKKYNEGNVEGAVAVIKRWENSRELINEAILKTEKNDKEAQKKGSSEIKQTIQQKTVHFMPNEPTFTDLIIRPGDRVDFVDPTAKFRIGGKSGYHEISATSRDNVATIPGSVVIHGLEKEGWVQVIVVPQNT